eukprot:ANDGO_05081.mRNA.1 Regulator of nonsense transcripts 1 homolog
MSSSMHFSCTYTKDAHKKQNRKWLDGFVEFKGDVRVCVLFGEDLSKLGTYKVPLTDDVEDGYEFRLSVYLVQVCDRQNGPPAKKMPNIPENEEENSVLTTAPSNSRPPPSKVFRGSQFRLPGRSDAKDDLPPASLKPLQASTLAGENAGSDDDQEPRRRRPSLGGQQTPDVSVCCFEVPSVANLNSGFDLIRRVEIPVVFHSPQHYCRQMYLFVKELVDLSVMDKLIQLKNALAENSEFLSVRRRGISFYPAVTLNFETGQFTSKDGRRRVFWSLSFAKCHAEASAAYSKDDVWILCDDKHFGRGAIYARSLWHGVASDRKLAIVPFHVLMNKTLDPVTVASLMDGKFSSWDRSLRQLLQKPSLFAIRLDSIASEVMMIEHLSVFSQTPLCNSILSPASKTESFVSSRLDLSSAEDMMQAFGFNADQRRAFTSIVCWASERDSYPIQLLHGVFGSGKSHFLVAVILFVLARLPQTRILLVCNTNCAVDNLLCRLVSMGLPDTLFARVGSRRKVHPSLLHRTVGHEKKGDAVETAKDIDNLIHSEQHAQQISDVLPKLLTDVREAHKLVNVSECRLVGATFSSCTFPSLSDESFDLCIQDESSQTLEPMSIVPLARFNCTKLLLSGDPLQLPPTIPGRKPVHSEDEVLTMFDRLAKLGATPIVLRTQYRCHPHISAIANALFYSGLLKNGIDEASRSPTLRVDQLNQPVTWVDSSSLCEASSVRQSKLSSSAEVLVICHLLSLMVANGVCPSDVGCICMYKQQLSILEKDEGLPQGVFCGTVDSFQGGEKDIIILSLGRWSGSGTTSFLEDPRRMCVALTRARRQLFIVGPVNDFPQNTSRWGSVVAMRDTRVLSAHSLLRIHPEDTVSEPHPAAAVSPQGRMPTMTTMASPSASVPAHPGVDDSVDVLLDVEIDF